ncbi:uncharacterized protein LOC34622089 [Cyclospora cayetanensis]|uniref:Uncharacterized protein LOC34622089 n=1 Tax=Cyclospora cayetanensis TaxID=88456 RepID=A0A6P6S557_9EIME|nr:uncharacterized protein LOC34622089 [Cyclospora cayetanensis]
MPINRLNSGYSGYLSGQSESSEHLQVRSDTFYGRLGSVRDTGHATTPTRRKSFSQQSSLRRISVRLSYDEDAYPGGLDIDMFALLYDTSCTFVDCIFYKHPEDASGSFSLNQKTNSLAIDLESVPDSCHTIVLAAAVYTTGMSITELDGGIIEIFEGFMGPTLISIELQSLDLNGENGSDAAGFVFLALSEFGGKWRCRRLERFCKPELPVLMKVSKEESQQLEEDFAMGNLQNLRTLDFAAKRMEVQNRGRQACEQHYFCILPHEHDEHMCLTAVKLLGHVSEVISSTALRCMCDHLLHSVQRYNNVNSSLTVCCFRWSRTLGESRKPAGFHRIQANSANSAFCRAGFLLWRNRRRMKVSEREKAGCEAALQQSIRKWAQACVKASKSRISAYPAGTVSLPFIVNNCLLHMPFFDLGERKTVARLSAVEAEQQRMSRRLMNIEDKLDMLLDALK